jgi:hypothetical protein
MSDGILWTQRDRFGNEIYLTRERWAHIVAPDDHPEMAAVFEHLAETIRYGRRRQDACDPNGYQYTGLSRICRMPTRTWLFVFVFGGIPTGMAGSEKRSS